MTVNDFTDGLQERLQGTREDESEGLDTERHIVVLVGNKRMEITGTVIDRAGVVNIILGRSAGEGDPDVVSAAEDDEWPGRKGE